MEPTGINKQGGIHILANHPDPSVDHVLKTWAPRMIVGRKNVTAGTDCGLGPRVGSPQIVWAKSEAMAEGARVVTKKLLRRQ